MGMETSKEDNNTIETTIPQSKNNDTKTTTTTTTTTKEKENMIIKKISKVEEELGIKSYLSKSKDNNNKGFYGIFKKRYSDFIVNEIDMNDNIAKLVNDKLITIS